jgi:hypothetical protein
VILTVHQEIGGRHIGFNAVIDKTRYPKIYEECLTKSLALVGKTPDFLQSEQFKEQAYGEY